MKIGVQTWRSWMALAVIAWGALMCCCPAAKAAPKKTASCCEKMSVSHCPASQDGPPATCAFIELRRSFAPAPAVDQLDAPQVCPIAEVPPQPTIRLALVAAAPVVWATPPPLQTLLDLHCALLC